MLGLKLGSRYGCKLGVCALTAGALSLGACTSGSDSNEAAGGSTGMGGSANNAGSPSAGSGPGATAQVSVMTIRRLNRTEYGNTIKDLVGTTSDYGAKFPPENLSFGFDNIGEALTVQPLHIELYEESAEAVLTELLARPATDAARQRILTCDPAAGRACMTQIVANFAQWAYRRPVVEAEVAGLVDIAQDFVMTGGTAPEGVKLALKGVLLSPHFIYRVELDQDPASPVPHRLNSFELASRLSYYLWSTMPDQPLLLEAQTNNLLTDAGLSAQIERMLKDPRSSALILNFVGQWLNLRRTDQVKPDYAVFPSFDDDLRASLKAESQNFVNELVQTGRPISDLLTAPFTYVNKRLATHYGMAAPAGDGFARVDLTGTPRLGFLTQGSFLVATSNPTRTSPVKRGKWVLDQLLCAPPPPPPPGVDVSGVEMEEMSVRQRLEAHRAKEPCRSCHAVMDPIGLSFENYDGIGAYRTADQYGAIDAAGSLPTAEGEVTFQGASELMPILAKDPRLAGCVAQKVLTYAVGRGYSGNDAQTIQAALDGMNASNQGLRGLFASVAQSEAFRSRRAVGE